MQRRRAAASASLSVAARPASSQNAVVIVGSACPVNVSAGGGWCCCLCAPAAALLELVIGERVDHDCALLCSAAAPNALHQYSQSQAPAAAGHNSDAHTCMSCNLNDLQSSSLVQRIQQLQQGLNHMWLVKCAAASTR
jgi:hypothetical protein